MATDTMFGTVRQFEDFLLTAVADKPEIDILSATGVATEINTDADGRLRLDPAATDDDDLSAVSFNLNWIAGESDLYMEARFFIDDITDNKFFVGFGDNIASGNEKTFSATTDTVVAEALTDGLGILFDDDATTKVLWAVAAKTDNVTVDQALPSRFNPVAAQAITLGCKLSLDRKFAEFYVNGELVHTVNSTNTLVAAVALCPIVQTMEQGTAFMLDVDYLYAKKGRSTS